MMKTRRRRWRTRTRKNWSTFLVHLFRAASSHAWLERPAVVARHYTHRPGEPDEGPNHSKKKKMKTKRHMQRKGNKSSRGGGSDEDECDYPHSYCHSFALLLFIFLIYLSPFLFPFCPTPHLLKALFFPTSRSSLRVNGERA